MADSLTLEERRHVDGVLEVLEERLDGLVAESVELEDQLGRLGREQGELRSEIEAMRRRYPPLPRVMTVEVNGVTWQADGFRMFRDAWPGPFEVNDAQPNMGKVLETWSGITEPAHVAELADQKYVGPVARFSNGAWVRGDWLAEVPAGLAPCASDDVLKPIVFRDPAGAIAAIIMPINLEVDGPDAITNRRAPDEPAPVLQPARVNTEVDRG